MSGSYTSCRFPTQPTTSVEAAFSRGRAPLANSGAFSFCPKGAPVSTPYRVALRSRQNRHPECRPDREKQHPDHCPEPQRQQQNQDDRLFVVQAEGTLQGDQGTRVTSRASVTHLKG